MQPQSDVETHSAHAQPGNTNRWAQQPERLTFVCVLITVERLSTSVPSALSPVSRVSASHSEV